MVPRGVARRILISFTVVAGAGVAVMPWMETAGLRDLAALRPWLRTSAADFEAFERSFTHFAPRPLWTACLVGVAIHLLMSSAANGFSGAPRVLASAVQYLRHYHHHRAAAPSGGAVATGPLVKPRGDSAAMAAYRVRNWVIFRDPLHRDLPAGIMPCGKH